MHCIAWLGYICSSVSHFIHSWCPCTRSALLEPAHSLTSLFVFLTDLPPFLQSPLLSTLSHFERNTTWTEPAKVRASPLLRQKLRIIDLSYRYQPVTGSMADRSCKWTLSPCQPSSLKCPSLPLLRRVYFFLRRVSSLWHLTLKISLEQASCPWYTRRPFKAQ